MQIRMDGRQLEDKHNLLILLVSLTNQASGKVYGLSSYFDAPS